jgi:DNA replication protein DnaC
MELEKSQEEIVSQERQSLRGKLYSEKLENYLDYIGLYERYRNVDVDRIYPIKEIKEYVDNLDQNIKMGLGLFLCGSFGVGKTSILSYLIQKVYSFGSWDQYEDIWRRNYSIQYCTVSKLFNLMFRKEEDELKKYQIYDFLVLDEFGREYDHDFPLSRFEELIDYRYGNMKTTCIATNLTIENLKGLNEYAHILSRFSDRSWIKTIQISGEDQRKKNL